LSRRVYQSGQNQMGEDVYAPGSDLAGSVATDNDSESAQARRLLVIENKIDRYAPKRDGT